MHGKTTSTDARQKDRQTATKTESVTPTQTTTTTVDRLLFFSLLCECYKYLIQCLALGATLSFAHAILHGIYN